MEEAAAQLEIVAQQLSAAWALPSGRVMVDPSSADAPSKNFATLTPTVEFGPPNSCNQMVSLTVDIGARFPLASDVSPFRQRAQKVELARRALVFAAQSNPDVPRIGDKPNVTTGSLDDPIRGQGDPSSFLVTLTFETVFFIDVGTGAR